MSHNSNNNNGRLHACVHAAEDIELIRVTTAKYYAPLPLRWVKKDSGQAHTPHHFRSTAKGFLLLLSVCIQRASCMSMLRLFFYRPEIWTKASWVVYNGSIWTQVFLKRCQGRQGKKQSFWYMWTWPNFATTLSNISPSLPTCLICRLVWC